MLQIHIESHHGNGVLVTCAKIILPTWCANWKPHAPTNGRNRCEYSIDDSLGVGWDNQATCSARVTGNGIK